MKKLLAYAILSPFYVIGFLIGAAASIIGGIIYLGFWILKWAYRTTNPRAPETEYYSEFRF